MAKRVRACRFGYPRFLYGLSHRPLQHGLVKMMPALLASNPIGVVVGRWKNPLPWPFSTRVRVFALQRVGILRGRCQIVLLSSQSRLIGFDLGSVRHRFTFLALHSFTPTHSNKQVMRTQNRCCGLI